jgi:hypothetical protein
MALIQAATGGPLASEETGSRRVGERVTDRRPCRGTVIPRPDSLLVQRGAGFLRTLLPLRRAQVSACWSCRVDDDGMDTGSLSTGRSLVQIAPVAARGCWLGQS